MDQTFAYIIAYGFAGQAEDPGHICLLYTSVRIHWIDSEEITAENAGEKLADLDGILVPGGFGQRCV